MKTPATPPSPLRAALETLRPLYKKIAWFGLAINIIALAPTIYMFQVYGRVVNSRNTTTLLMLTLLVLGMYVIMEILEWVRGEMQQSAGQRLEQLLGERVFNAVFDANLRRMAGSSQGLTDLKTLREFLPSPSITALMDAPMALLYLVLIFVISPMLGLFSVLTAIGQVFIAYLTEKTSQPPLLAANRASIDAQNYANHSLRNSQVIEAMGMLGAIHDRWMKKQRDFLHLQAFASDQAGGKAALSKILQNVLSSGLLGLSCLMLLHGELLGGAAMLIIPGVLGGKVLQPLVLIISSWKQIVNTRDAYQRLDTLLQAIPKRTAGMPLPAPRGNLSVEGVIASAPGSPIAILRGISFTLPASKTLMVVGPSAAGKSTLARLLVGIWPTSSGKVRLDGADVYSWNKEELGPHVGYLPQGIELFDGTLAENIARFGEVDMDQVVAAAAAVGLHEIIQSLPEGYDSRIGDDGCFLSGGQRQRVGLARALYGNPRFVVLDEPNSSLDEVGEKALVATLQELKARGTTLVVITHRTSVLGVADAMLILRDGMVAAYGPRDEVLATLNKAQPKPAAPASTSQLAPA